MDSTTQVTMYSIGYVKTDSAGDEVKDKTRISEVIVNPELEAALDGISEYSHLYVLFWMNEIPQDKRMMLRVHPRGRMDLPLMGAFAVRTNLRPNPIGLTVVELLGVKGNILTVRGLDAFNATPVLDIKPYDPWDVASQLRVPNWWKKLEDEKR